MNTRLAALAATCACLVTTRAAAAGPPAPPPANVAFADVNMMLVNKRESGSFTLRWQPARDGTGKAMSRYAVRAPGCTAVRTAAGAVPSPLPGGLVEIAGPPFAALFTGCRCALTSAVVVTVPVAPYAHWSTNPAAALGNVPFPSPCKQ